jgi:ethylene receptor
MVQCTCLGRLWTYSHSLGQLQSLADTIISVAYFSFPIELMYFGFKFKELPQKGTLVQFVLFILLCGCTHLLSAHELTLMDSSAKLVRITTAKCLTALVSAVTALFLFWKIPRFLRVQEREHYLKLKADELDQEVGVLRRKDAATHSVRMLSVGIYSSLDTMTILETTIVELSKVLDLTNCAVWSTGPHPDAMHVVSAVGSLKGSRMVIPVELDEVQITISSQGPVPLDPRTCLLGSGHRHGAYAVSLVLPQLTFQGEMQQLPQKYILALAKDSSWRDYDWEVLEIATSQISVAISHAHILRDLAENNLAIYTTLGYKHGYRT